MKIIKFISFSLTCCAIFAQQSNKIALDKMVKIEIKPIDQKQVIEARNVIMRVAFDTFQLKDIFEEFEERVIELGETFSDLQDVDATYFDNSGIFLVIMDGKKVVGTGAIKRIDDSVCELKRLFILKKYQGKGLGSKLMNMLMAFAKEKRYKKIVLDIWYPEKQQAAIGLYTKCGFHEVHNIDSSAAMILERVLDMRK